MPSGPTTDGGPLWFCVRCVINHGGKYEERLTVWQCENIDVAIEQAIDEANKYANSLAAQALPFGQAYVMFEAPTHNGTEVFSLIRDSELSPGEYLDRYFDTGNEYQKLEE